METQTLPAEVRTTRGKGPARQLRMAGKIPAVLYGAPGDSVALTVDPATLTKALSGPYRRSQLFELEMGDGKQLAIVKDLDVHPVSREIRHADFYRVSLDQTVTYQVPLRTVGRAKGVVAGGTLRTFFRTIPITVAPDKVPADVTLNVESLDGGEAIRVSDVKLEAGEIALPSDRVLTMVVAESRRVVATEEEAAPAKGKK